MDHPRGCGEHWQTWTGGLAQWESSPRMRGALMNTVHAIELARIIPADAGSTSRQRNATCPSADHPRGCGEHTRKDLQAVSDRGSSPRMRGAHSHPCLWLGCHRIIPADAGSTPYHPW